MRYFTSDWHIGHEKAMLYSGRPFTDVKVMDETIIKNMNSVLTDNDELFVNGDLTLLNYKTNPEGTVYFLELFNQVKGKKKIIPGNHDREATLAMLHQLPNTEVLGPYVELKMPGDQLVVLCHYPMLYWNKSGKGSYMLHGHMHDETEYPFNARILDVGVDANNFMPFSWAQVNALLKDRPLRDHHARNREQNCCGRKKSEPHRDPCLCIRCCSTVLDPNRPPNFDLCAACDVELDRKFAP